jgi:hypothetical protein
VRIYKISYPLYVSQHTGELATKPPHLRQEDTTMTNQKPEGTVKLQGIPGYHPGTPVSELRPGDVILWNFGETSTVLSIEPVGKMSRKVTTLNHGKTYIRNMRSTRLVVRQTTPDINVCETAQALLDRHGATLRPLRTSRAS